MGRRVLHIVAGALLAAVLGAPLSAGAQETPALERFERSRAPESLKQLLRDLPPGERRRVLRRLSRATPEERRRFVWGWERMSRAERAERRARWLRGSNRDRLRGPAGGPTDAPTEELALPEELEQRWRSLPEAERDAVQETLRELPPEPREKLRRALTHWEDLSPREQRRVTRHLERLRRFSTERRGRIERNRERWEELDSGRRASLRERLRGFRKLPAEEQQALVERRFGDRSAEERARILEGLRRGEPPR